MSEPAPLPDTERGACQRAARALLAYGIVTTKRPSEREYHLVRRYADRLDADLGALAGYRVHATRTAVRLVRRIDALPTAPVLHTPGGLPFDRVRYALLALALAALERSGSQTTVSELALRVRRAAVGVPGLPFDPDEHASRQALAHAVRALEDVGALALADGSLDAWEQGRGAAEALYDVDRDLCRQLCALPRGLHGTHGTEGLLHREALDLGRDPTRRARRRRLVRLLLERPVVYFADLDEASVAYVRREARSLADDLERLTGARLERRQEGLALVDPGARFSDRPFPGTGSEAQVALLLCDRLERGEATVEVPAADDVAARVARALDHSAPSAVGAARAEAVPGATARWPFVDDAALRAAAADVQARFGAGLKAQHRDDAARLLSDALDVLAAHDLVRRVPGGVALMPALARFRAVEVRADEALRDQLGLFGGPS